VEDIFKTPEEMEEDVPPMEFGEDVVNEDVF